MGREDWSMIMVLFMRENFSIIKYKDLERKFTLLIIIMKGTFLMELKTARELYSKMESRMRSITIKVRN